MAVRIDPLGAYNFYLTLIDSTDVVGALINLAFDFQVAGFSECNGLDASMEIFEIREGGVNDYIHRLPTRATHGNITLRQGAIYLYDDIWDWHYELVQGNVVRKDGVIVLLDEQRRPAKRWKFKRGIPVRWVGPSLDAQQSATAIESLEIAHEGLTLELGS